MPAGGSGSSSDRRMPPGRLPASVSIPPCFCAPTSESPSSMCVAAWFAYVTSKASLHGPAVCVAEAALDPWMRGAMRSRGRGGGGRGCDGRGKMGKDGEEMGRRWDAPPCWRDRLMSATHECSTSVHPTPRPGHAPEGACTRTRTPTTSSPQIRARPCRGRCRHGCWAATAPRS
eukprot:364915-Chlamydomonas_euryale.AAC.13